MPVLTIGLDNVEVIGDVDENSFGGIEGIKCD